MCQYWAHTLQALKPRCPRDGALQQEKPPQWEAQAPQLESSPYSLQLEKAHVQQGRPSKPKQINKRKKKIWHFRCPLFESLNLGWKSILFFCAKVAWILQARVGCFILTDIISINKALMLENKFFFSRAGTRLRQKRHSLQSVARRGSSSRARKWALG